MNTEKNTGFTVYWMPLNLHDRGRRAGIIEHNHIQPLTFLGDPHLRTSYTPASSGYAISMYT